MKTTDILFKKMKTTDILFKKNENSRYQQLWFCPLDLSIQYTELAFPFYSIKTTIYTLSDKFGKLVELGSTAQTQRKKLSELAAAFSGCNTTIVSLTVRLLPLNLLGLDTTLSHGED